MTENTGKIEKTGKTKTTKKIKKTEKDKIIQRPNLNTKQQCKKAYGPLEYAPPKPTWAFPNVQTTLLCIRSFADMSCSLRCQFWRCVRGMSINVYKYISARGPMTNWHLRQFR